MNVAYTIFVMETATTTPETEEFLYIHQHAGISCSIKNVKAKQS